MGKAEEAYNLVNGFDNPTEMQRDGVRALCELASRGDRNAIKYLGDIGATTHSYSDEITKMAREGLGPRRRGRSR